MAYKMPEKTIAQIQRMYRETPIYSHVAKILGISPSTVKKYVLEEKASIERGKAITLADLPFRPTSAEEIALPETIEELVKVTETEEAELRVYWNERGI